MYPVNEFTMTDGIKHECGIALIRLLKPLEFYHYKYGTWKYGLHKLYLLMEKQRNRGQDGAGVACIHINMPPGYKYIYRLRATDATSINEVFSKINAEFKKAGRKNSAMLSDPVWARQNLSFAGELFLGHLRYGTFGKNKMDNVHPVMRQNNWKTRNLVMAGNFNLTNVEELFQILVDLGQHPKDYSDTVTILENVGHFLDQENQRLFDIYKKENRTNREISDLIAYDISIANILRESSKKWDGGFTIAGLLGHGDAFAYRDPWGIRPAFWYHDDEIAVVASERPVIQTVMNLTADKVSEIEPGHAVIIRKDGRISMEMIREPYPKKACSFERIYFSRGSDKDIYNERKKLGELLTPLILEAIDHDLDNTVFSFIPNTAESAFYGMIKGIEDYQKNLQVREILKQRAACTDEDLRRILNGKIRVEKVAIKDLKLRTFITQEEGRDDLVGHVYDITYETVRRGKDNLVIIDDSIVRGTTLRESILRILDRLGPRKIVVVSSSPQIRYPDCYGIDMAKLGDFVAFQAAIALLKERGREGVINDVYNKCKEQESLPKEEIVNYVREIYEPFSHEEVSEKISELLTSREMNAEVKIVYQTVENLHKACPGHLGDWYFTGDYPTPGGNKVVNRAFIYYIEGKKMRAY
jgi:amidophosphoribosyltransferase